VIRLDRPVLYYTTSSCLRTTSGIESKAKDVSASSRIDSKLEDMSEMQTRLRNGHVCGKFVMNAA